MHDPATCRDGDHYGQCSGATPLPDEDAEAVRIAEQSAEARAEWDAGYEPWPDDATAAGWAGRGYPQ